MKDKPQTAMFKLLRKLSSVLGAERAHDIAAAILRVIGKIPGGEWLLRKIYPVEHESLEREVFGLRFRNPVGMAAGFDRNGDMFRQLDALGFGFVEIGTVTPRPQPGNPRPRVFDLPEERAIVNRVGLASKGLDRVICNLRRPRKNIIIGCNIGKNTSTPPENATSDYLKLFRNLYQYVDYFTVNVGYDISPKGCTPRTREAVSAILSPLFDFRRGQNQYRPILLKLSPDLSNDEIDSIVDLMMDSPLDGIVATNATMKPAGIRNREALSRIKATGGGAVSGAPLTARAIEVVSRIYERSHGAYPIIGAGGLMTPADVKAMLNAGATLVQIYTGYIYNGPRFVGEICRSLMEQQQEREKAEERKPESAATI